MSSKENKSCPGCYGVYSEFCPICKNGSSSPTGYTWSLDGMEGTVPNQFVDFIENKLDTSGMGNHDQKDHS